MTDQETLYHYTSAQGLLGIFKGDGLCFWATKIQYMNDASEFAYAIDLLSNELDGVIKHEQDLMKKSICKLLRRFIPEFKNFGVYVACFSQVLDDLGQWRGYCTSGAGFCIGINFNELNSAAVAKGFCLRKCIYSKDEQLSHIGSWINSCIDLIANKPSVEEAINKAIGAQIHSNEFYDFVEYHVGDTVMDFFKDAAFFKNPAFMSEAEWRMVKFDWLSESVKFRPAQHMLIPYMETSFGKGVHQSILSEIVVGPTPHPELSLNALKLFLSKRGLANVKTSVSVVPYRAW